MQAKEIALAAGAVVALASVGIGGRILRKRMLKKVITPKLMATAQEAVELSKQNANNQLIATLKELAAKKGQQRSELAVSFDTLYSRINTLIDFDPRWKNGTDYFNGAMTVGLAKGHMAKATGDCGRRLILIGTDHGTAVFFERYTLGHGPFVVVNNTASQLRDLVPNGSLDNATFNTVIAELTK